MAYNSSTVVANDDILASQYNNLRADITEIRDADGNLVLPATKALILDGAVGNTKILESSPDVVDHVISGAVTMRVDVNGIAPGGNESLMWDVVIFSLDGTSPDSVGYSIEEDKIYGLYSVGHVDANTVSGAADATLTDHTRVQVVLAVMYPNYGSAYGVGDMLQVIIFYVP